MDKKKLPDASYKTKQSDWTGTNHIVKLQTNSKANRTIDLLGCSLEFFKKRKQIQFTRKTTTENHMF